MLICNSESISQTYSLSRIELSLCNKKWQPGCCDAVGPCRCYTVTFYNKKLIRAVNNKMQKYTRKNVSVAVHLRLR